MRKVPVSFHAEVTQRFQFLVDHGFDGPEYSDDLLPGARYGGAGLTIWIIFNDDTHDSAGRQISVSIRLDTTAGFAKADLDEVVEAAVFAPRHRVARKAHSGDALRATLDDNAMWIRRLLPILRGPGALETIRKATQWETDRRGNPKRRPKNINWRYG